MITVSGLLVQVRDLVMLCVMPVSLLRLGEMQPSGAVTC